MFNNGFLIGLIGFFGGIVGGVLINVITYGFLKRSEKRDRVKTYVEEIKDILEEICNTWDDYRVSIYSDSDSDQIIEMKKQIHKLSRELTKKTSMQYSRFLNNNTPVELREMCALLTDSIPLITKKNTDSGQIENKFDEICGKAHNIKKELDNIQLNSNLLKKHL